jgi:hypothetical protein
MVNMARELIKPFRTRRIDRETVLQVAEASKETGLD